MACEQHPVVSCQEMLKHSLEHWSLAWLENTWFSSANYRNVSSKICGSVATHSWKLPCSVVSRLEIFRLEQRSLAWQLNIPCLFIKDICCCCNPAENVSWLAISSGFTFGKCWNTILNSGLSRGSKTYLVFWCKPSRLIKQYVLISNIQWFQAQKMLKHCLEQWSLAVICQNILDVFNETWEM